MNNNDVNYSVPPTTNNNDDDDDDLFGSSLSNRMVSSSEPEESGQNVQSLTDNSAQVYPPQQEDPKNNHQQAEPSQDDPEHRRQSSLGSFSFGGDAKGIHSDPSSFNDIIGSTFGGSNAVDGTTTVLDGNQKTGTRNSENQNLHQNSNDLSIQLEDQQQDQQMIHNFQQNGNVEALRVESNLRAIESQHYESTNSFNMHQSNMQQQEQQQQQQHPNMQHNEQPQQQQQQVQQHQPRQAQNPQKAKEPQVIVLLDDSDEEDQNSEAKAATSGVKRPAPSSSLNTGVQANSYRHHPQPIVPGSSIPGYSAPRPQYGPVGTQAAAVAQMYQHRQQRQRIDKVGDPMYIDMVANHTPTWREPIPPIRSQPSAEPKAFELSLLNLSEFTITGLPVGFFGRPSSVLGFRKVIKAVSRGHGKAVFDRDKEMTSDDNGTDRGKWRIPSGCVPCLFLLFDE